MPCFYPVSCWRYDTPNNSGTRPLIHQPKAVEAARREGHSVSSTQRPCGYCSGCRLEKARQIAMRCYHESTLHAQNSFLTLTYDGDHLPPNNSISTDEMQRFWKRLRDRLNYPSIKYYAAGEYGDKNARAHYHACLFGYDFPDRKFEKNSGSGEPLYTSELLQKIWGNGNCWLGDVTFESAAYVARYTMKKRYGKDAEAHYARLGVEPERSWSSQGLAKEWFEKYGGDCYPSDKITMRGKIMRPPAYYDRLLHRDDPELLAELKADREAYAKLNKPKINFDIRKIPATKEVHLLGEKMVLSGTVDKTVSDIVHGASMRFGRVDNER